MQEIVWRHKELQANVSSLQQQVNAAEEEQDRLVRLRQHEIIHKYRRNGLTNGVSTGMCAYVCVGGVYVWEGVILGVCVCVQGCT